MADGILSNAAAYDQGGAACSRGWKKQSGDYIQDSELLQDQLIGVDQVCLLCLCILTVCLVSIPKECLIVNIKLSTGPQNILT